MKLGATGFAFTNDKTEWTKEQRLHFVEWHVKAQYDAIPIDGSEESTTRITALFKRREEVIKKILPEE